MGQILTKDGKAYQVVSAKEHQDKMVCVVYKSIPLSEVESITFRKVNAVGTTTLVVLGGVLGFAALIFGPIYASGGDSIPY